MKFCKLADIADWQDPEFQSISSLLEIDEARSRKFWEYIQVYRGLRQLGLLNDESRALGLGVGRERLIYAFANVCGEVVATDLYSSQNWQTAAMPVEEVYERNPFAYRKERLVVQHMDMTRIEYPDNSFDFIWSCCSIEHVNSFKDLHQVYREIHRVLKPGGIAALTTEYNLSDHHSYEPNMLFTDRFWIEQWLTGNDPLIQGFELQDQPDLTLTDAEGNRPQPRRQSQKTSVPLYSRDFIINSVAFFLRKAGEFSRNYDDNWLPEPLRIYLNGCDKQRHDDFVGSEALFKQLFHQESTDDRLKVASVRRLLVSLQAQGKTEEAIDYCRQVIPYCKNAADTDHLLPIAHQCKKFQLWEEAQYLYQKVIDSPGARDVQVIRCLLNQAEYFIHQRQPIKALKLAEKACNLLPTNRPVDETSQAQYHRGLYLERIGLLKPAIEAYQLAIEASAPHTKVHRDSLLQIDTCRELLQKRSLRQVVKAWVNKLKLATVANY